jgi:transcriptional regulator with XRE-family HTH domain
MFGREVRRRRVRRGWTQADLAAAAACSRSTIISLEHGARRLGGNRALRVWPLVGGTTRSLEALWRASSASAKAVAR